MGSQSDWPVMKHASDTLKDLSIKHEKKVVSAHRTPDLLLSIVQMPAGIPVATVAIGKAGSINAALLAASILSIKYPNINKKILAYRKKQTQRVLKSAKLI